MSGNRSGMSHSRRLHQAHGCGIHVSKSRAIISLVAAAPVAVAGWVFAHASGVISPDSFNLNITIIVIAAVVLGGIGTVWGPIVGIVIVEGVSLWMGAFSSYNTLLVGIAILVLALAVPRGIIPTAKPAAAWLDRFLFHRQYQLAGAAEGAGARTEPVARAATETRDGILPRTEVPVSPNTPPKVGATSSEQSPPGVPVAVEEAFIGRTRGDGASAVNAPGDRGDPICELVDVHKRFSGVTVLEGANGLDQGIE